MLLGSKSLGRESTALKISCTYRVHRFCQWKSPLMVLVCVWGLKQIHWLKWLLSKKWCCIYDYHSFSALLLLFIKLEWLKINKICVTPPERWDWVTASHEIYGRQMSRCEGVSLFTATKQNEWVGCSQRPGGAEGQTGDEAAKQTRAKLRQIQVQKQGQNQTDAGQCFLLGAGWDRSR